MKKSDFQRLYKAKELVELQLSEISNFGGNPDKVYGVAIHYRSANFHMFFSYKNITPLFLCIMPVKQMVEFVDLLYVMANVTSQTSSGADSRLQSDRISLLVSDYVARLGRFRDALEAAVSTD